MARLDTGWHANPKVLALGLPGMALHAWSISYCDSTRSDGFIPQGAWPSLAGVGAACKALVTAGLWERCEGGFRLHDYLQYNRSKEQIEAEQADARERVSRHRDRRNGGGNALHTQDVTQDVTPENSVHSRARAHPVPVPGTSYARPP